MKKLLSPVFTIALLLSHCHGSGVHAAPLTQTAETGKLSGKWQMTIDTPHGVMKGPFTIGGDGTKLTATLVTEMFGSVSGTGTSEGATVSFSLTVPGADHEFTFSGKVDGDKMSGETMFGGAWSAVRE